jgi:outer membrane protein
MKKLIQSLIPALVLLGLSASPALAEAKTAIIDLRKVFDNYWKTKEADAQLKEKAAEMDKTNKGLIEEYKRATEAYQKLLASANDQAVAAEERAKRKKSAEAKALEIRESEQTIETFRRQAGATLDEKKRQMRDKILAEIRTAINAKAKAAGFSTVFDSAADSANATPVLIYTNGENDITDEILATLNVSAPVALPKSAAEKPVEPKK